MVINGCCPKTNEYGMTFLVIDGARHRPSVSDLLLKDIKVKGCQSPAYDMWFFY